MVPAGNKAIRLSSANHTTKTIHHLHHHRNSVCNFIMALSATVCFKKSNWLECHRYFYLLLKNQFTNTLLLGDSIIADLSRYLKVWQKYVTPLKALNFGIGGKRVENVLRWSKNLLTPPSLENVVVELTNMWNQPFHRLSFGYIWLYCQHWLLFA